MEDIKYKEEEFIKLVYVFPTIRRKLYKILTRTVHLSPEKRMEILEEYRSFELTPML